MRIPAAPPRLRDSEEFGEILQKEEAPLSAERINKNGEILHQRLASSIIATGAITSTTAAALIIKIGVPIVLSISAATTAYLYLSTGVNKTMEQPPSIIQRPRHTAFNESGRDGGQINSQPQDAVSSFPMDAESKALKPRSRRASPKKLIVPIHPFPPSDAGIDLASIKESMPAPWETSELPAQLRLFHSAQSLGKTGSYSSALTIIEQLLTRYPHTPLRAEAEFSQVDFLIRAGRNQEALPKIRKLLNDPNHQGRQGELWRVLGNILQIQGNCSEAIKAYQHALAFPLRKEEIVSIRHALKKCAAPEKKFEGDGGQR